VLGGRRDSDLQVTVGDPKEILVQQGGDREGQTLDTRPSQALEFRLQEHDTLSVEGDGLTKRASFGQFITLLSGRKYRWR
jgi:hypothetical protein